MADLYVMVGVAGCGKSSYVNEHKQPNDISVSSDDMRIELFGTLNCQDPQHNHIVFQTMQKRCMEGLQNGNTVWYDATNLSRKRRRALYDAAKSKGADVCIVYFIRPLKKLYQINDSRPLEKQVPKNVIKRMYVHQEVPRRGVDCDFIVVESDPLSEFEYEFENDTPHDSSHHKESVKEHIEMCVNNAQGEQLKTIATFHDLGKFITKEKLDNGYARFINHQNVSANYYVASIGMRLNCRYNQKITEAIFQHMQAHIGLTDKHIKRNKLDNETLQLIKDFAEIDSTSRIVEQ